MKELPDDKTLLELLELAKEAEQKTKEAGELIEAFAQKWERGHLRPLPLVRSGGEAD